MSVCGHVCTVQFFLFLFFRFLGDGNGKKGTSHPLSTRHSHRCARTFMNSKSGVTALHSATKLILLGGDSSVASSSPLPPKKGRTYPLKTECAHHKRKTQVPKIPTNSKRPSKLQTPSKQSPTTKNTIQKKQSMTHQKSPRLP